MNQLHHVALSVNNLEWYENFFTSIFSMHVRKRTGETPNRKVWFTEGIQLNECISDPENGNLLDHFALQTNEMETVIQKAIEYGCVRIKDNWIQLPDGILIEFMQ